MPRELLQPTRHQRGIDDRGGIEDDHVELIGGALITKDRDDLPAVGRETRKHVSTEQALKVRLLDHMLRAYLARRQLALPDPPTDRLGVATCSPGGLRYGEHVL